MNSALHHNRVGKKSREQSRTEETDYEGKSCDECESMSEWATGGPSRHAPKTRRVAYFVIVAGAS